METKKAAKSVWYWQMPSGPWFVSVRSGLTVEVDNEIVTTVAANRKAAKARAVKIANDNGIHWSKA